MKVLFRVLIGVFAFALLTSAVFADVIIPTETEVFFYIDGEPVNETVEYEISCQGWHTGMPGDDMEVEVDFETDPTEEVFSYSATCEEFGCTVDESYYGNYRTYDSCSLTAEVGEDTYELENFNDTPLPPVEKSGSDMLNRMFLAAFDLENGMMLYKDVAPDNAFFDAIKYISEKKIVSGYADGTYGPQSNLNRAEFVKILMLSKYQEYDIYDCDVDIFGFSDVATDDWFAPYVCMAKNEGIIDGYEDGTFKPENTINYAEASKIVVETLIEDFETSATAEGDDWYEPYIDILEEADAMPEAIVDYSDLMTRDVMADTIYILLEDEWWMETVS